MPLTVLAILVAYLFGRQRRKRGAASTAAASVGAAYERRSDLPPGQQQQMGMPQQQQGGVFMGNMGMAAMPVGEKVAGVSEMDVKSSGGMMPMYATPPSSVGSPPPMMAGYTPPPQGVMTMQPAPPGMIPGGQYMVYPQGPVYEAPAGEQTPAVAQAVPHEMPQQNTVYEAPGS